MKLTLTTLQSCTLSQFHKIVNILEFGDYIWNDLEKCIQISTNTPSIGLVICEIGFEF